MSGIGNERRFVPVQFGVVTVSDTRSIEDDRSGNLLESRIAEAGHELRERILVRDDIEEIRAVAHDWTVRDDIDAIIFTGGTGFTGRDVTPDALEPLYDKAMDGFSAIFHRISYDKIGTSTIQSRASAGSDQPDLRLPAAGLDRRLQGCLGRHSQGRSSTIATCRAISWKSCRGWTSTSNGAAAKASDRLRTDQSGCPSAR